MLPIYYPPGLDPALIPPRPDLDPASLIAFAAFLWSGVTYLYYAMFGW